MDFSFLRRRAPGSLAMGFVLSTLGLIPFFGGVTQLYHAYELSGSVPKASGEIQRLYITQGGKGGTTYHISYSFVGGATVVTVNDANISRHDWYSLHTGQPIQVRYLAGHATICEPDLPGEVTYSVRQGWGATLVSLLFVGAGFFVGLFLQRGNKY